MNRRPTVRRRLASGLILGATLWATSTAAANPSTQTERAESSELLLQQGREAFEGKRYEEAHARLTRAYEFWPSYRTACALGQVELELEMYRDAAGHLDVCLARYPAHDPQQALDRVLEGLREARRHVAVFEPIVNVSGATILVNGEPVGTTPLDSDLFVEPGLRRVTVRKPGFADSSVELLFTAGGTTHWQAQLAPVVSKSTTATPGASHVYLGVGTVLTAVTLAGGGALSVIAHVEQERATRAIARAEQAGPCPASSRSEPCVAARAQLEAASQSSDLATATLWAGAGLGVVTAVIAWVTLGANSQSADAGATSVTVALQPSLLRGGAGATWIGRF